MYVASEGTRADIKGDIALVTCIATDSSWQVTCVDTVWVEDTIHECGKCQIYMYSIPEI